MQKIHQQILSFKEIYNNIARKCVFFYGKVNKNAYFTLFQVNKNVNLVIFNMSKIAFCRFRDVGCYCYVGYFITSRGNLFD